MALEIPITIFLIFAYIYIIVKAINRAAENGKGAEVPLWIFAIILLPVFGALGAIIHYPKNR